MWDEGRLRVWGLIGDVWDRGEWRWRDGLGWRWFGDGLAAELVRLST